MTEHHPAIAAQISLQKECIAKCEREIETLGRELAQMTEQKQRHQCMIDAYIDAEQRLLAALRPAPEAEAEQQTVELYRHVRDGEPPKRVKRDVRGAVMACFAGESGHLLSEHFVVERTGLPPASVRPYLLRAVKTGGLVREGDLYRLPRPAPPPSLDDFNFSGDNDAHGEAEAAPPWPPSPEKIVDTIRRAGDMGMNREQLRIIGATDDQLDELLSAGRLDYQDGDRRYRIVEDGEEVT